MGGESVHIRRCLGLTRPRSGDYRIGIAAIKRWGRARPAAAVQQRSGEETKLACSTDRYTATYVVAPSLGPPDCRDADFTDIQAAINALPAAGGKVFVKAGTYVVSQTILIE